MPSALSFTPNQSRTIDKEIRSISVEVGTLIVTPTDESVTVTAPDTYEAHDIANLTLYSPNGAKTTVVYSDEPVEAPAPQGEDLDDHTVSELHDLADERGVEVPSKAKKAEIIDALRAA